MQYRFSLLVFVPGERLLFVPAEERRMVTVLPLTAGVSPLTGDRAKFLKTLNCFFKSVSRLSLLFLP